MKIQNLRKTLGCLNFRKLKKPSALCVTMLFIISTLSIFGTTAIQVEAATPVSYTFGNTTVGTLTNYFATDRDASRFQLTQSGVLQSITTYFKNTGFNAKAAIYTDNNGAPSTLITQSNTQAITTSGWQTFTVPQSSLTAGYYWLCVVSSSPSSTGTMTATSTNTHAWKTNTYSGDYPSTFGAPAGYEKTVTSIYATYTATTVTPSPTPVPTVTPSPTPVPTVTPSPTPVPTKTPTPTPTATPTPSTTSSKLNAIWLEHPETEFLNQNQQTAVQKLLNSNTKIVFVQIGNWQQSGSTVSINYWWSSQTIKNTINAIKTYSNNQIEVHAWIIWSTGNTRVNLADSNIRTKTVTAAVNCVQSYGFDGFNDDLYEGFTGTDSNYVAYANALGNALTAICKKSSVDLFAMYATNMAVLYGGITQVTYVCPMFYDNQPWYPQWIKDQLNAVLTNSKCQVLAGLMVMQGRGVTLTQQLSAVGHPTSSKFAGIALWSLAYMQTTDWTAYNTWTK